MDAVDCSGRTDYLFRRRFFGLGFGCIGLFRLLLRLGGLFPGRRRQHGAVVPFLEGLDGFQQVFRDLVPPILAAQGIEVVRVGDEADFHEDGGHRRPPENPEGILGDSPVPGDRPAFHGVGDILGEHEAVFQVGVLHQAEQNIGLRVRRVEALVTGLVIVFKQDYGVLPLDQVQVLAEQVVPLPAGLPQAVDGVAVGGGSLGLCVDVDGDEQVRTDVVGDVGPSAQGDEPVVGTREDGFHAGKRRLDLPGQSPGDVQGDALLLRLSVRADAAGVVAAVARVDDDGGKFRPVLSGRAVRHDDCGQEDGPKEQNGAYRALHGHLVLN